MTSAVRTDSSALHRSLQRAAAAAADVEGLADAVLRCVRAAVPYDFACFATTDPATGLITGAFKSGPLEGGVAEWAQVEYGGADLNTFAEVALRRPPVAALVLDTSGRPQTCRRHREFMEPRYGFTDELRAVFTARGATWGALAAYRGPGGPPFTPRDVATVAAAVDVVAEAVQRVLFSRAPDGSGEALSRDARPAVLLVDPASRVTHLTPAAASAIGELGGWQEGELPDNVLAAVARARSQDAPVATQSRGRSGRWLRISASPLAGGGDDCVVTVDDSPGSALSRLTMAAHGLTSREEEVVLRVLRGEDTKAIAGGLHLSAWTVQDHLKAVFAKLGVSSRRELAARLVLG